MDPRIRGGVLATFSTATDAVSCACSIIKVCKQIEDLKLRIGIHQGEVIFENNDVYRKNQSSR